ncbi:MAG: PAS domain S-box protein [Burkholderiales bacterium]|nr:PAS domain S-box protein [Burkholderiales bacterium]
MDTPVTPAVMANASTRSALEAQQRKALDAALRMMLLALVLLQVLRVLAVNVLEPPARAGTLVLLGMTVVIALAWWLLRRGHFHWAVQIFVYVFLATACADTLSYGSVRGTGLLTIMMSVVAAGVFLSRRAFVVTLLSAVAVLSALSYAEVHGLLPVPQAGMSLRQWLSYCVAIVVSAIGVHHTRGMLLVALAHANNELAQRQKVEERLRQSEARFSKGFHFVPVAMVISRLSDGKYLEVNEAQTQVLGYTREELLASSSADMNVWPTPQDREHYVAALRQTGRISAYDVRFRNKNGGLTDCRIWAEVIEIDDEECVLACTINITDQKQREAMLLDIARGVSGQTGKAFFRSLVTHLGHAIQADVVMVGEISDNAAPTVQSLAMMVDGEIAANITYDLAGTPCATALHGPQLCKYQDDVDRLFPTDVFLSEGGFKAYMGVSLRDADGTPVGILNAMWRQPLAPSADRDALIQIFASRCNAELTRLRRDRQIQDLHDALEQRVKDRTAQLESLNAELESFAYSVSHDLKTPLTTINGFTHLLQRRLADRLGEDEQRLFQRVLLGTARMEQITTDILALSRVSRSELKPTDVNLSLIATQIMEAERQRHPQRQVQVQIEPDVTVHCDLPWARIVLENLIGNAWKYSQHTPRAHIAFGALPRSADGPTVLFVRDNGAGFNMAHADKLFKPFHRLHGVNDFEGNGVGLATVHRILERHGGAIWCEAAEGQGATFYFSFDGPRPVAPTAT